MRIAVWHNLPSGGGKRALYYHVRGLIERGHDVEAWCPPTADQTYLPLDGVVTEHVVPLANGKRRWRYDPLGRLMAPYRQIVDRLRAMDDHCMQCARQISAMEFDLLFASACRFFRTSPIARDMDIPSVLYLQEPYRWLYEAFPQLPWLALPSPARAWWRPAYLTRFVKDLIRVQGLRVQVREELQNAQLFDAILVNSLFSRESVLRAYGLNARLCYLGVDTDLFHSRGSPREHYVIGVGSIYLGKGIERAIRAVAAVPDDIRPPLVWVGNFADHGYEAEVAALAESLGVGFIPKVQVSDGELVDLLGRATAMIYTPRLEPFGLAALEANACETPVVGIAEGGVRETIQQGVNGLLVKDDAPGPIAEALIYLLRNPKVARQMGIRAREYVLQNWTLDAAVDRLEGHLLQVAALGRV